MSIQLSRSFLSVAMALTVAVGGMACEPVALPPMPDSITFILGRGQAPLPDYPDYWGGNSLGYVCSPILAERDPLDRTAFLRVVNSNFSFVYHNLHVGDVIPIVRGIYRIETLNPGVNEMFSTAEVVCRRIDTQLDGVNVTPGAYAFVFHPKSENEIVFNPYFEIHRISFTADFIPKKGDVNMAVKVDVLDPIATREVRIVNGVSVKMAASYTLQVGDKMRLGKNYHRVVNIVPPGKEKQVIGWFEINIKPEPAPSDVK